MTDRPRQPSAGALLGCTATCGPDRPDRVDVRPGVVGEVPARPTRATAGARPARPRRQPGGRDWTPDRLAERGDVPVEITAGRERSGGYEQRFQETVRTVTLAELARMLATAGESNGRLVARGFFGARLQVLREELRPPPGIIDDTDRRPGRPSCGSAGRHGHPAHRDDAVLFPQVRPTSGFGSSRVRPRLRLRTTATARSTPVASQTQAATPVDIAR